MGKMTHGKYSTPGKALDALIVSADGTWLYLNTNA
jgi:hypothetical protein